jgi:hypothetical protein
MPKSEFAEMDRAAAEFAEGQKDSPHAFGAPSGGAAGEEVRKSLRAAGVPAWLAAVLQPLIADLLARFDAEKVVNWLLDRLGYGQPKAA